MIGRSRGKNCTFESGHGTLGLTHACGSGASVARIVSGLALEVYFTFLYSPSV